MEFMKRYLSNVISSAIYYGKKIGPLPGGLRILTYHRVNDISGDRLSVRPEEFEKQMEWLTAHEYTGVNIKEGLEILRALPAGRQEAKNLRHVAITFDDGYLDNYTNAFPILRKYGYSATVYVITERVESNDVIPAKAGIQFEIGPPPSRGRQFLSWDEIKEMNQAGIEIGSHTVSHPRLVSVDLEKARQEILNSKREIEDKLKSRCESFCYPGGMWNPELARSVRECGYSNATTVMPGINTPEADPFLLKRTEISGEDSLFEFEKKINGAYDFLHKMWQAAGMLK